MLTLIHGPVELLRTEALANLRQRLAADPELAELNTTRLDAAEATVAQIQNACDTLPFLAERRLVIVHGLLRRLAGRPRPSGEGAAADVAETADEEPIPEVSKGQVKALLAYLDAVPASTELVFVEEDLISSGPIWRRLLELAREDRARIIACARPRRNELPDWIRERARLRQVRLDVLALNDLVEFVGDDLRQLDQELIKLRDYAGQRTVTREDVRRLVPATRAANVFDLVDALGMGDGPTAGRLLRHALDVDGEQPLRLLAMIARQYRLLLLAKAHQARGVRPPEIARELGVPDWTVSRLLAQAGRHTFSQLEQAIERIAAADEAIKTGKLGDREAMDVLLAELLMGTRDVNVRKP